MNALIPLVVSIGGMAMGALVSIFGVVRAARQPRSTRRPEPAAPHPDSSQVLITVSDETPAQPQGPQSEVVIYNAASGKAEHYAVAESATAVAMRVGEAAQRALQPGKPTHVETANPPRIAMAD
jgi:hypothetical protein